MSALTERRTGFEQLGKLYPKAASVVVEATLINGVRCYWFTPEKVSSESVVIYLHGGVYAVGSIRSHESMVSHFADRLESEMVFVEYALTPEHPYPQGLNDVVAVYKGLLKDNPGVKITVMGDSAGGGLAVALVAILQQEALPVPQAIVMISPWIDLDGKHPSYAINAEKDRILSKPYVQAGASLYAGDTPVAHANPDNLAFKTFPPVLMMAGSPEVLLDDSRVFYERIKPVQDNTTFSVYEDQQHVWPLSRIDSEASQKAIAEIGAFLQGLK